MKQTKQVDNLIWIGASHVKLLSLTLRAAGNHLVQVAGEQNADYFYMADCILQDAYEQLFKVSKDRSGKITSDFGIIERTIFEYTQGIGPNWYIGGIDVHTAKNWLIKDNAFFNIASPRKHIAEHAIHFWSNSIGTRVIGNLIVDSDRGIGFGMAKSKHYAGEIRNNFIYHGHYSRTQRPFADVGIVLESSTNTKVIENFVYLNSGYANAIEYRYRSLDKNLISDNVTNKRIKQRNFGSAHLIDNKQLDDEDYFQQQLRKFVDQHPLKARLASRLH
ncbi:right-handed parallel beta-helix repeat-containing protein [Catenovulum sp. SX2]|uniref:right-handed parallel beta-helix repeat-containing protein n=1 Tax=Catenovulum sp. SX2 TaxID=3398614 RepID=UPI003F831ACB